MQTLWYDVKLPDLCTDLLKDDFKLTGPFVDGNPEDSLDGVEDADFLLLNAAFPGRNPDTYRLLVRVKAMVRFGVGYDNVDLDLATTHRVCVLNTPDGPSESTAEFAMLLILNLARPMFDATQRMRAGEWSKSSEPFGVELAGKTLGLVGMGRIGSRLAEMARGFRMRIVVHDPYISEEKARALGVELVDDINEVYGAADFLSLHAPLLPGTRGLINREAIARMKKGAYFVNAARGGLVIEKDLQEALENGHLAGAALDVWDPEPPAPDNPLAKLPNVIATPHIASTTWDMRYKTTEMVKETIHSYMRGERPPNLLNADAWENRKL